MHHTVTKELKWASYTNSSSSSSLLLQEEEELVEVMDPVESRGSSCLFLFVEPCGFNGVLLQSEECFKEQPREHSRCEGEKQPQAGWTGNSGQ